MSAAVSKPDFVVSDRMMTCPACSRVLQVDDDRTLPLHKNAMDELFEAESGNCPGSYTKARPHRMLPEMSPQVPARGFTYLDILPDDDEGKRGANRDIAQIAICAKFLCDWLGPLKMKIDEVQMNKIIAHATRARQAAQNLIG